MMNDYASNVRFASSPPKTQNCRRHSEDSRATDLALVGAPTEHVEDCTRPTLVSVCTELGHLIERLY